MERVKYIIANWKMNGKNDSIKIVNLVAKHLKNKKHNKSKVIICPPYTLLSKCISENKVIDFGGQDCHHSDKGAYTGSISASMLKDVGCKYVIIGHSERREYHNESSDELNDKINQAIKNKLVVIYCIGEKLNEINKKEIILEEQINSLPKEANDSNLIIAYEPVWAIGTGKIPSTDDILNTHLKIRYLLSKKIGTKQSEKISILYGGSVNASNSAKILNLKGVDGALVGGASLIIKDFCKIIDSYI